METKNKPEKTFGEKLKSARKKSGLTQEQLAVNSWYLGRQSKNGKRTKVCQILKI